MIRRRNRLGVCLFAGNFRSEENDGGVEITELGQNCLQRTA